MTCQEPHGLAGSWNKAGRVDVATATRTIEPARVLHPAAFGAPWRLLRGAADRRRRNTPRITLTDQSTNSMFPAMRGPEKQFDREQVLGKAMELFWHQGYAATGMTQLLDYMGIGRQSLYDTFGDKRSLYLAALERYLADLGKQWKIELDAPGLPLGNLRRLFRCIMKLAEETGYCGCFIGNAMAEFGDSDREVRRVLATALGRMEDMLAGVLQRAQEAGELSPQARPRDLAKLVVVAVQGSALMSKLEPRRRHAHQTMQIALRVIETS